MDISLVIPSFNRAALIIDTVESALNQKKPFAEIIVVDDASTDDTLKRLEPFRDRITIIASSKVGVQEARNIGARASRSPYVTFCDSDDLLEPNYVEVVGAWLVKHEQFDAVYTNHVVFTHDFVQADTYSRAPQGFFDGAVDEDKFLIDIPDLYARSAGFQPMLPCGATVKRAFYEQIGGFDPAFNGIPSEDWEFTLRVLRYGKVALCPEPLARIRRHPGNESRSVLRQCLGEITIIEHGLSHHDCLESHRPLLAAQIDRRRLWAFEEAFGTKKLRLAAAIFPLLGEKRRSFKFFVKSVIIRSYMILTNYQAPSIKAQYAEALK